MIKDWKKLSIVVLNKLFETPCNRVVSSFSLLGNWRESHVIFQFSNYSVMSGHVILSFVDQVT